MDPQKITYFGETDARGKKIKFGIKAKDRLKHMYIIGKTGMGKSTLLENLAIQDIQSGEGLAFIDPHGGTAEKLLEYVPEHRVKDVLYFAPFDMEYPISFNVMEDIGADKRHLVVNGLMSTFEKIWVDAWSARMAYILNNTLLALLEYPGSTLLGVNRMLSDKEYRKKVVENIKDTSVKAFWVDEFGKWTEKFISEAIPAIQNKVGQFTSNPLVRNLLGQPQSSFDIRKMMDEKKILIVNLSKGRVGEGNANLIGSMLITKIYLAAMSRADASEAGLNKLPNFYLYVDEFQSFANKSFADILSEARKYKLNLTIAHQYIEQMEEEVRDAVFGNVGTMVTFRVGAFDAEVLEKEFAPVFTAEDLVNLGFTQIYLKLMIDGVSSQPFSATTIGPIAKPEKSFKEEVVNSSRVQFANPRQEVEEVIAKFHESSRFESPTQNKSQGGGYNGGQGNNTQGRGEFRSNEQKSEQRNDYKGQSTNNNSSFTPYKNEHAVEQNREVIKDTQRQHVEQNHFTEKKFDTPKPVFTEVPEDNLIQGLDSTSPKGDSNKLAFLKAAEELKKKEIERNPVIVDVQNNLPSNTENNKNIQSVPKPNVQDSRPNHEKVKVPTQENISSLKNALSSVLAKSNTNINTEKSSQYVQPKPGVIEKPPQQKEVVVEQAKPKEYASVETKIKEVPEDVLRKLLSMDEVK
ncbi:MAG: type IV secretory system conjugative DNA transfer family protein [Minisyncoccota bacterium]